MLKIFRELSPDPQPCVLLLGGFDGLHAGHRTLLKAARKYGCPIGITSISGGKPGGDLFTFPEREYIYERAGISFVCEFVFSDRLKNTSAEAFVRQLLSCFAPRAVLCGSDFRFGKGALGTPQLLQEICPCPVEVHELMCIGGEKVSSSQIKRLLSAGAMSEVNALLQADYFIQGVVEHGRHVGHSLGFPTTNLTFPPEKFPLAEGVYGGYAETRDGVFAAIVNVGARPTFGVTERKVEAYLDGFDGDLYGSTLRVFPKRFYRPVQRFSDAAALREQLMQDIRRLKDDQVRTER